MRIEVAGEAERARSGDVVERLIARGNARAGGSARCQDLVFDGPSRRPTPPSSSSSRPELCGRLDHPARAPASRCSDAPLRARADGLGMQFGVPRCDQRPAGESRCRPSSSGRSHTHWRRHRCWPRRCALPPRSPDRNVAGNGQPSWRLRCLISLERSPSTASPISEMSPSPQATAIGPRRRATRTRGDDRRTSISPGDTQHDLRSAIVAAAAPRRTRKSDRAVHAGASSSAAETGVGAAERSGFRFEVQSSGSWAHHDIAHF